MTTEVLPVGAAGRAVVNGRRQRRKGKNSVFSVFVSSVDIFLFDHLAWLILFLSVVGLM